MRIIFFHGRKYQKKIMCSKNLNFLLSTFIIFAFMTLISYGSHAESVHILKTILNDTFYDRHFPPGYDTDIPVNVTIQVVVLSIDRVREAAMDYSLTIYLRQTWTDHRLRFDHLTKHFKFHNANNTTHNATSDTVEHSNARSNFMHFNVTEESEDEPKKLQLDNLTIDKVWIPDTYFINERVASFHHVTVPNRLMHIFSNGTVYYSLRLSMTLTCDMGLRKYPFDRQTCPFYIGSYGYTDDMIHYEWNVHGALKVRGKVELPTFTITNWYMEDCHEQEYDAGNFSCLRLSVLLARSYGYYIAQVYVPSILIVILSWVSFWLDIDAIPARISLGLLTVLTMTTMGVGARSELPRVSYVKAIDLWMSVCLLFVFSALLEFAYVNVNTRVEKRRMNMREAVQLAQNAAAVDAGKKRGLQNIQMKNTTNPLMSKPCSSKVQPTVNPTVIKRQRARLVDKFSRVIFPTAFIGFNLFYWIFFIV